MGVKKHIIKIQPLHKKMYIFVIVFSTIYFLITVFYSTDFFFNKNEEYAIKTDGFFFNKNEEYAIKTDGCRIPAMEPINNLIKKYVFYPEELKPCPHATYSLLEQNGTHIWLVDDTRIMQYYKINKRRRLICCYLSFIPDYIEYIDYIYVDEKIKYNEGIFFKDIVAVNDEFVKVQCMYGSKHLLDQFFVFARYKNLTQHDKEKRCKAAEKPGLNVLFLVIDNMSRLNFHRTMPKTAEFMKNRGAVELMGYNKVGDNSFSNLVPLLMGYSVNEFKKICHPVPTTMMTFDNCPFLWHGYKDAGYYTAFGEDIDIGTLGNGYGNGLKGFRKTPTDYYLNPFMTEAIKIAGNNKNDVCFLCMNEYYAYQILLDYIQALSETLRDSKLFGVFWETSMSHDYLNYPMAMDESYFNFFTTLEKSNFLNKTVTFLMSDHGARYGSFRKNTKQGYLEERLPLANILVPPSFRELYTEAYNNLKYNSRQLTTPFDIHETLLDLKDLENIQNKLIMERVRKLNSESRAISLFLKVPQNRTCKIANIDDHWCTCHKHVALSKTSKVIKMATEHLISHMNIILAAYPQCAKLELDEIKQSAEVTSGIITGDLKESEKRYLVTVKVRPGGGVFEATLQNDSKNWIVLGIVSRLNAYHKSLCVNNPLIKLYCYCRGIH